MMTPVKMSLVEIVCAKSRANAVIEALYASGEVEIEKSSRVTEHNLQSFSFPPEDINEAEELRVIFAEVIGETADSCMKESLQGSLDRARTLRADAEAITAVRRRIASLDEKISADETLERCLAWLYSLGIKKESCASSARLLVICGIARPEAECQGELCLRSEIRNGKSFLIAAFRTAADAERLLKDESFHSIDIFTEQDSDAKRLLAEETRVLAGYTSRIEEIREADAALAHYLRLAKLFSRSGETQRCAHILCWLPSEGEAKIREALADDICSLRILPAETAIEESVFTDEEVPSLLPESRIFAPFRLVLSVYGHPAYRSIDPTVPGAAFFLIFFGLMFADIGHGGVLAVIGLLLLLVRRTPIRDAGKLIIGAGASSAFCGLLFGSFFGLEDVIPALLYHPAQHIGPFLFTGLAVGIIVISAGIVLNIAKSFLRREWAGAFFSQWGIITLGFYWLCAGIIAASFGNGTKLPAPFIIASAVLPLAAMTIGEIVSAKLNRNGEFSEIIFHPVEVLLGLLSNTVSFVRLAAFGLCHIALMSAVYIIASSGPDDPVYRISVSIEGNILVIGLELLVVTIQCLRLQFYEFFSKFFGAPGRRFAPLRTPHAREGA